MIKAIAPASHLAVLAGKPGAAPLLEISQCAGHVRAAANV